MSCSCEPCDMLSSSSLGGDRYVLGRSVLSMIGSGTQIVGLGLGGALLAVVAAPDLLLVAGALLLAAGVAEFGLRHAGRLPTTRPPGGVLRSSWRGKAQLLSDGAVRDLLLAQ